MQPADISDDVLEFLARRIDSVPHLEALLLFLENPDTTWSVAEIAARVYVSRENAQKVLNDLARHGFIAEAGDGYRYQQTWDEAQIMPRVAAVYRKHLVQIAELIHAKAAPSPVEEFARAFKFTKKE
jgi:DNA-binding IclR family transcriptional regulator